MTSKSGCDSWKKRQRGSAIIELALLAPVLIGLALGIADFGRVLYASVEVNNAARAGAQSALYTNVAGMKTAAVQDACGTGTGTTCRSLPGFSTGNVEVAVSCPCPGDPNPGTGTQVCSPVPTCAAGAPMVYVSVTTTYTFTTLAEYPGIPHTTILTGNAIIRAQ